MIVTVGSAGPQLMHIMLLGGIILALLLTRF